MKRLEFFVNFDRKGNSNFALPLILRKKDLDLKKKICKLLMEERVEYRLGTAGGGNQARQPYLEKYEFMIIENLDNDDYVHDFGLYVGNHPELTKKQIINLCGKLNEL